MILFIHIRGERQREGGREREREREREGGGGEGEREGERKREREKQERIPFTSHKHDILAGSAVSATPHSNKLDQLHLNPETRMTHIPAAWWQLVQVWC